MSARAPDLPERFIDLAMTPRRLLQIVRGLRTRSEFTIARLLAAKRLFSEKARPWQGRRLRKGRAA